MTKKLTHPKDITLIRVYTSAFQTSPWLFKSTFYRQEKWTQWRLHGQQGWERFEYHSTHSLCFTICFLGLLLHMTWACFLFFCCLHFCLQSNFRTRMKKKRSPGPPLAFCHDITKASIRFSVCLWSVLLSSSPLLQISCSAISLLLYQGSAISHKQIINTNWVYHWRQNDPEVSKYWWVDRLHVNHMREFLIYNIPDSIPREIDSGQLWRQRI